MMHATTTTTTAPQGVTRRNARNGFRDRRVTAPNHPITSRPIARSGDRARNNGRKKIPARWKKRWPVFRSSFASMTTNHRLFLANGGDGTRTTFERIWKLEGLRAARRVLRGNGWRATNRTTGCIDSAEGRRGPPPPPPLGRFISTRVRRGNSVSV